MAKTKAEFAAARVAERDRSFAEVDPYELWIPPGIKDGGWAKVPRTMPVILAILDHIGEKGLNVATTYMDLWTLDKGEGYFEITSPFERATLAGFSGARRETTWAARMQSLEKLGFLKTKSSASRGRFAHVLLINPHLAIRRKYETSRDDRLAELYDLLQQRARDAKCHDAAWLNVTLPWPSRSAVSGFPPPPVTPPGPPAHPTPTPPSPAARP